MLRQIVSHIASGLSFIAHRLSHIAFDLSPIAYRISYTVREILLCILSAFLLILSFPRFDFEFLAWFGFVPLFFVIQNKSKSKAFLFSYLVGVLFWSGIIYWLVHVTLVGTVLLILYLALYFGLFGLIISRYLLFAIRYSQPTTHNSQLFLIPSIWVLLEYLRSCALTGFPWALLGYSQYKNLPIIQISDITGAWGASFLVMMVNVAIYSYIVNRTSYFVRIKRLLVPLLIILATLIYGYFKIYGIRNTEYGIRTTDYGLRTKISVIQGNIPQELKWAPESKAYILNKYIQLSKEAASDSADLIVWPEAASPSTLGEDELNFKKFFSLAHKLKTSLLIGTVVRDNGKYFNSALLIDDAGKIAGRYDKLHLVPFGEYIPLKKFLPFLETVVPIGDTTAGEEYTVFSQFARHNTHDTIHFSVLICFEDLFPELSRRFVKKGAQFLINITNDAWYKKTPASYQHLQASVFRAIENRVSLVRSANTGISGFIGPTGKIISLVKNKKGEEIFITGFETKDIHVPELNLTFYTRYGNIFILLLSIFCLYGIFRFVRRST